MHPRAEQLIAELRLEMHPEGGYYRELFRSRSSVLPSDDRGPRAALTTIYFLLTDETASRWHRVRSDEVWHLYEGGPLELLELDLDAQSVARHRLTQPGDRGAPVHTIPADRWQAARSIGPYVLVGCSVGPGFDFADFQLLADDPVASAQVLERWPELSTLI